MFGCTYTPTIKAPACSERVVPRTVLEIKPGKRDNELLVRFKGERKWSKATYDPYYNSITFL